MIAMTTNKIEIPSSGALRWCLFVTGDTAGLAVLVASAVAGAKLTTDSAAFFSGTPPWLFKRALAVPVCT